MASAPPEVVDGSAPPYDDLPPSYEEAMRETEKEIGVPKTRVIKAEDYHCPDCGPRADQYSAFGWYESKGWKDKWPVHYSAMKGK